MNSQQTVFQKELNGAERRVLQAIRDVSFGSVEVVIHERRIAEIRQTSRIRSALDEKISDRATGR